MKQSFDVPAIFPVSQPISTDEYRTDPKVWPVDFDGNAYEHCYLTIANNPDGMIILARNKRGRVISIKEVAQDKKESSSWTYKCQSQLGVAIYKNFCCK